ncbi:MAG: hypothetical protein AAF645_23025 [Myxococcota bacterium]
MRVLSFFCLLSLAACGGDGDWSPAFDADARGWILSVWGPDDGDALFAVGGQPGAGAMTRFDGSDWNPVDVGGAPLLNWVHGLNESDYVVVGDGGFIARGNGTTLTPFSNVPTAEQLWGAWMNAADDIWAVGGAGVDTSEAVVLHFDGRAWTKETLPALERPNVFAFFKVWASGPDDVIVVGQRGVILRYDGSEWREFGAGTSDDLISLWGTGPDRVVAVGGRGNGVMATWNGTEWRSVRLSPLAALNGVWTRNGRDVHVAGIQGTLAVVDFDSFVFRESFTDATLDFHAIFGRSSGLTAVGGNLAAGTSAPIFNGLAWERSLSSTE